MILIAAACASVWVSTAARQVIVRHPEGLLHGFLSLRALDGTLIGDGDLLQSAQGSRVTSRLVFHFKDGSLHDETTVFTQGRTFRLVSDHLVQKGPSFPKPVDMVVDVTKGEITVDSTDERGQTKHDVTRQKLPENLANGLVPVLLKDIRPDEAVPEMTLVAATPKPRLVTLAISSAGDDSFTTSGRRRTARHYVVKVKLGGVAGVVAPLIGKQPPDSHVWILQGDVPAFIKAEQPFYADGPVWRIELVSPSWP